MTRAEAIAAAFRTVKSEVCCSSKERRNTDDCMIESLKALGVTDDELPRTD